MKNKYLAVGLVCLAVLVSGCSFGKKDEGPTKEELAVSLQQAESQLTNLKEELKGTKEVIASLNPALSNVDLRAVVELPDGNPTYLAINNQIRLGTELSMEPNRSVPNKTLINLPGGVTYTPSNNWSFDINNNYLTLTHKNGMRVQLKVYNYLGDATPYDVIQSVLEPYVANLSVDTLGSKIFFVDNSRVGGMLTTSMAVKSFEDGKKEQDLPEETILAESELETIEGETVGETTAVEETTSTDETTAEVETFENSADVSLGEVETVETEIVEAETESDYIVKEYIYNVGVIMSGEYSITLEVFYENDDNAPIQAELLTSCLQALQINGKSINTD